MIYFVAPKHLPEGEHLMRLGYSSDSARKNRLETHETNSLLSLVACMPGSRDTERKLHEHFTKLGRLADDASRSFYAGEEIWEYVERLLFHGYASDHEDDLDHLPEMPWSVLSPEKISKLVSEPDGQMSFIRPTVRQRVKRAASLVKYSSATDEWYTPVEIIESARKVLGTIDLDPASCPTANRIVKATRIYSQRCSGLSPDHPWSGRVWMNPPFGGMAQKFSKRLLEEFVNGNVPEAVALFSSMATVCRWFEPVYAAIKVMCLSRGRPKFTPGDVDQIKGATNSPGSGVVIVYLGTRPDRFAREFAAHGQCLAPYCILACDDTRTLKLA